jgi:hypothetical protein
MAVGHPGHIPAPFGCVAAGSGAATIAFGSTAIGDDERWTVKKLKRIGKPVRFFISGAGLRGPAQGRKGSHSRTAKGRKEQINFNWQIRWYWLTL